VLLILLILILILLMMLLLLLLSLLSIGLATLVPVCCSVLECFLDDVDVVVAVIIELADAEDADELTSMGSLEVSFDGRFRARVGAFEVVGAVEPVEPPVTLIPTMLCLIPPFDAICVCVCICVW